MSSKIIYPSDSNGRRLARRGEPKIRSQRTQAQPRQVKKDVKTVLIFEPDQTSLEKLSVFLKKKGWKKTIINIKKKKLVCGVAYPRRESVVHDYIKKIIKKGKIGKLIIIKSNFSQDFRKLRKDYKKIYYSKMSDSGGIIFDALSHHLNLLTYYAGKIRKINKSEMKLVYSDINVNDTALISIHFKNNVFGIIFGNQFQKPNIDEIEFIGTKSNIIFDRINNRLYLVNKNKRLIKSFNETYEDLFLNQIKNFLGCLKKRVKPKTTLSEELENLGKL